MGDCPRDPAIRVLMMPRDTNYHGTIFGGIILSHIDQAGAVGTLKAGCRQVVTVAMDKVVFQQPVHVGDLVSFYTEVTRIGNTSITVRIQVEAERRTENESLPVTKADMTFVNVDDEGKPTPVPRPQEI